MTTSYAGTGAPYGGGGRTADERWAAVVTLAPADSRTRHLDIAVPDPETTGIRRTRLVERLVEGARLPLVVVTAPAGYGKTTLLRQWAAEDRRQFAWVHVDAHHDDPPALLGAVIRALDEVEPLGRSLAGAPSGLDAVNMLWSMHIGAALATRRAPAVVVVDDVHHVKSASALAVLSAVLEHLPAGSQMVLAGRSEPAFELLGGTARNVMRLGTADLAFDASEAELLLSAAGLIVQPDELERIMSRTECWPNGLTLAAATVSDTNDVDVLKDAEHATAEYFRREVLDSLDDGTVQFLTRTSVLDELTGSLCDAVTERSYSSRALERLDHANAFLVALDARHRRYRYHALFREFLRDELGRREPETVALLHRRAGAWCEQHGRDDQAIKHAIAGEDTESTARLVWSATGTCIGRGRSAALRETLDAFTDEQIAGHPLLALAAAAAELTEGHADDAAHWLWLTEHTAGDLAPAPHEARDAHVSLLRALLGQDGLARVEADVDRSLDRDDERSPWRALGGFYSGLVRHLAGDVDGARARLEEAAVRSAVLWPAIHAAATAALSLLDADAGRWDDAAVRAERALRYVDERRLGDYPLAAIVPAIAAVNAVHHGEAGRAREQIAHSERLVTALGRVAPALRAEVRLTLAWTSLQLGDTTGVRQQLRDVRPLLLAMPDARELRDRIAALDADVQAITDTIVGPLALTVAERRVLTYLPMHLSLSEIAQRLFVSRNTVKSQAIAIYRKLAVSSRGAAVTRAQELGLLEE